MNLHLILALSGSKYIGEWHQDLKHGKGKFVYQSGQVFEGQFHKDTMLDRTTTAGLHRPQTPLGSLIGWREKNVLHITHTNDTQTYTGDIDHSDIVIGGSITEMFNLEISKLLPESNIQHELNQIHCVLLSTSLN